MGCVSRYKKEGRITSLVEICCVKGDKQRYRVEKVNITMLVK